MQTLVQYLTISFFQFCKLFLQLDKSSFFFHFSFCLDDKSLDHNFEIEITYPIILVSLSVPWIRFCHVTFAFLSNILTLKIRFYIVFLFGVNCHCLKAFGMCERCRLSPRDLVDIGYRMEFDDLFAHCSILLMSEKMYYKY